MRSSSLALNLAFRLAFLAGIAALGAVAGCGGSVDDRPAKWSFIAATIVEPSCATVNCHSAITAKADLDFHDRESGYYSLVNGKYVIASDPEQSTIVEVMTAQGSLRMPPDVPLPTADIDLIEAWIASGIPNN
jgi:hypothetical protein